jgi:uncharacterized protein YciI
MTLQQLNPFWHIASIVLCVACQPPANENATDTGITADTIAYDSAFAAKTGADEYGMKSYVMAYLKAGPNRSKDAAEAARLQRAHLDNITRMADAGTLVLAGPFLDNGETRGIYIFNVATLEEAEALTATDPAIQAGTLIMELHPWYGSAALMELNTLHKKLAKKGI